MGHGNFIINLFALKLLSGVFYLGATLLIWKVSRNITFLTLFALNPLIVIETLVGGHNDIVMIFLAIFSFFLIMRKKILLGVLSFILSIFIKYTTVLLVPIFIFILWKIIRKKEINYEKIFYHSSLLMYIGFLLSPIREEIYPWYAIWFLPFVFLIPKQKILLYTSVAFSFGLMFRYVPFMLLGFYTSPTPLIKTSVTFAPVCLVLFYFLVKKLWVKISSQ